MKNTENKLYVYRTSDWWTWASIEYPDEEVEIVLQKEFTKSEIHNILNNWNMTLPLKIINEYNG